MLPPAFLLAVGLHLASGESCGNCEFPFTFGVHGYHSRTYTTCTTIADEFGMPWCSTKTNDGFHVQGNWEYCTDPDCPGVTNPAMEEDERNAVGKCVCGVPNKPKTKDRGTGNHRIVGGVEVGVGEFPWQVALLFGSNITTAQGCGGTLITDRHVLTAAHCTSRSDPSDIHVLLGDTSLTLSNEIESLVKSVSKIDNHEEYNDVTIENDISILTLDSPVNLTSHQNIKPACLPALGTTFDNAIATVSGWGTTQAGYLVDWLNKVEVTAYAYGDCGSITDDMTPDMLCAGVKEGGKDSCQGDSGGPLITSDPAQSDAQAVIGVVSWGYGCAREDSLGVYSEVSHNREWIDGKISGGVTCPPPDDPANSGSTVVTEESTTSMVTTPTTAATDCYETNMIPSLKKVSKGRMMKTDTAEECQNKCQDHEYCQFFRWKKSKKFCVLLSVSYKQKNGFISGPRNC